MRRYLLPPMSKTTQLPTALAVPNSAFKCPQACQQTSLLATWVYQARSGASASSKPGVCQNRLSRALEMTRIALDPWFAGSHASSQKANRQAQRHGPSDRAVVRDACCEGCVSVGRDAERRQASHFLGLRFGGQDLSLAPPDLAVEFAFIRQRLRPFLRMPAIAEVA